MPYMSAHTPNFEIHYHIPELNYTLVPAYSYS